ncbi:ATP-binding cassette domain-containing protein [Mycoplasma hafezii]|uniref:ATP-binding cassette domain-containing protein n=1 Tax=Mycoplasma hafezii TaxID=525886 RepID=UPI003CF0BC05
MEKSNAIEFIEISKYFGEIKANQDISFQVKKGTVHALIGENGAGKSTLMSILFGLYQPDKGIIKVNDKEVLIKGPNDANALGIGMVHQHFKLVDVYTNLENIILGDEPYDKNTHVIDKKPAIQKIKTIQEAFDLHFDLNKITGTETVATQQKVEIMKMLYRDSEILIFDEPTAVLTDQEIKGLLNTFKLFREQGKTILFISHKLGEVKEVADNATVIRHGKVMGNFAVADVSIEEMARRMVGSDVEVVHNEYTDTNKNEIIMSLQNVSTASEKPLKDVSLDIRAGEIVAIAGVEGNGQTDLEYVLSGMIKPTAGQILYRKTKLVNERYTHLAKSQKESLWIQLGTAILATIIGIILMCVKIEQDDISAILRIFGGFTLFISAVLYLLFINKITGFSNIFQKALGGKKVYQEHFAKRTNLLLKIDNIATIVFAVISTITVLLSLSSDITRTTSIIALVTTLVSLGLSLVLKSFFFIKKKTIFIETKAHKNELIAYEVIYYLSTLAVIFLSGTTITKDISGLKIANVVFAVIMLFLVVIGKALFLSFTYFKEETYQKEEFINIADESVYDISKLGFSFIPSDRHKHGLVLDYNIKSNTVLRRLWDSNFEKFGFFKNKNVKKENDEIIEKYDVRGARRGLSMARSLSGGNQQKFIVGREMNAPHDFILIMQPTRGLDVGAIKNIHKQILDEKANGKAILLISYELDEVLALADKIAVINSGEILVVKDAKDLTRTEIGMYMAHKNKNVIDPLDRGEVKEDVAPATV